jgi:hypothetical protein
MKKSYLIILLLLLTTSIVITSSCSKDEGDNPVTPTNVNHAPGTPNNPSPADGAVNVPRFVSLSWTCTDPDAGDTVRFDIYAGSTNTPLTVVGSNVLNNAFDLGLVSSYTTVYWKVVAKDNSNAFTEGPVWSFTTGN